MPCLKQLLSVLFRCNYFPIFADNSYCPLSIENKPQRPQDAIRIRYARLWALATLCVSHLQDRVFCEKLLPDIQQGPVVVWLTHLLIRGVCSTSAMPLTSPKHMSQITRALQGPLCRPLRGPPSLPPSSCYIVRGPLHLSRQRHLPLAAYVASPRKESCFVSYRSKHM